MVENRNNNYILQYEVHTMAITLERGLLATQI